MEPEQRLAEDLFTYAERLADELQRGIVHVKARTSLMQRNPHDPELKNRTECISVITGVTLASTHLLDLGNRYRQLMPEKQVYSLTDFLKWKEKLTPLLTELKFLISRHLEQLKKQSETNLSFQEKDLMEETDNAILNHQITRWPYISVPHISILLELMERCIIWLQVMTTPVPYSISKAAVICLNILKENGHVEKTQGLKIIHSELNRLIYPTRMSLADFHKQVIQQSNLTKAKLHKSDKYLYNPNVVDYIDGSYALGNDIKDKAKLEHLALQFRRLFRLYYR